MRLPVIPIVIAATLAAEPPRGYSIPLIDLAGDTARQVIVDREPGQYLGHPTTVLLEDGRTIYCVYPKGHGRGALVLKRSDDGALTWSDRLPVPDNWATSLEVPTLYRVVDPAGVKRLIIFSGLYPIRMTVSDDDGASWGEPLMLDPRPGVSYPDAVEAADGRIFAVHDRDRGGDGEIVLSVFTERDLPSG